MKHYKIIFLFSFILTISVSGQNTIGVLSNSVGSLDGYTLFTAQKETYLINNCGEIVNQWTSNYNSGRAVYLLANGNLLRAANIPNPGKIKIKGFGGRIELFNWGGDLIWEYEYSTTNVTQHHDIFPMANGNILMLAASILTYEEAIQLGRKPEYLGKELYNEQILELKPVGKDGAIIVWQWDIKDHLIQDFDDTKSNFGIVSDNPQRLDINFLGGSLIKNPNWLHANSIQYNNHLDQIIISIRSLSEIYIIDHSTTTAEAASSIGGKYSKGGDFLYRWGNPVAYGQGTVDDQKLFGQHYPHWITEGFIDADKIIVFNNGWNRSGKFSEIDIINPPTSSPGVYTYNTNTAYGPVNPDYIYSAPKNTDFFSPILSSAQRLSNGNTLICEGTSGYFFEIDQSENIVWEYINPATSRKILIPGSDSKISANSIFRAKKYDSEYAAFDNKTLTPKNTIEEKALEAIKNELSNLTSSFHKKSEILKFETNNKIDKIEIYNLSGQLVVKEHNSKSVNLKSILSGLYLAKIYSNDIFILNKIIKK